jgi:hypothetical protein
MSVVLLISISPKIVDLHGTVDRKARCFCKLYSESRNKAVLWNETQRLTAISVAVHFLISKGICHFNCLTSHSRISSAFFLNKSLNSRKSRKSRKKRIQCNKKKRKLKSHKRENIKRTRKEKISGNEKSCRLRKTKANKLKLRREMENLFKANWISKWILFLLLASSTIHSAIG